MSDLRRDIQTGEGRGRMRITGRGRWECQRPARFIGPGVGTDGLSWDYVERYQLLSDRLCFERRESFAPRPAGLRREECSVDIIRALDPSGTRPRRGGGSTCEIAVLSQHWKNSYFDPSVWYDRSVDSGRSIAASTPAMRAAAPAILHRYNIPPMIKAGMRCVDGCRDSLRGGGRAAMFEATSRWPPMQHGLPERSLDTGGEALEGCWSGGPAATVGPSRLVVEGCSGTRFAFDGWTGDAAGTKNPLTITGDGTKDADAKWRNGNGPTASTGHASTGSQDMDREHVAGSTATATLPMESVNVPPGTGNLDGGRSGDSTGRPVPSPLQSSGPGAIPR